MFRVEGRQSLSVEIRQEQGQGNNTNANKTVGGNKQKRHR